MSIPMTPVKGYRQLSAEQIALMNQNKLIEELAMRQIDAHVREHGSTEIDQRMVALARTNLQDAFMWLNRSIAQPQRIRPTVDDLEAFEVAVEGLVEGLLRS